VAGHTLYAGDGNSTLKAFNLNAGNAQIANLSTDPASTANVPNFSPAKRVDEMAFDPVHNVLLAANNAAVNNANVITPFATLINAATNTIVPNGKITFDGTNADLKNAPNAGGANGGIEQSVFDPTTGKFFLNIVQINGTGSGGIARINPLTGVVEQTYSLAAMGLVGACAPSGLAVGTGGKMLMGCGDGTNSILFDPAGAGSIKVIPGISGEDMVWFDPIRKLYFLTARNNPNTGPELGIVDEFGNQTQPLLATSTNAHSIAVDPVTGEAFMPFGGFGPGGVTLAQANTCGPAIGTLGCIAVFALVPEPGSLALLSAGLVALGGFGWRRRRRSLDA